LPLLDKNPDVLDVGLVDDHLLVSITPTDGSKLLLLYSIQQYTNVIFKDLVFYSFFNLFVFFFLYFFLENNKKYKTRQDFTFSTLFKTCNN